MLINIIGKISFSTKSKNWEKSGKHNKNVTLDTLSVNNSDENSLLIKQAGIYECNSKRENQVILLMITDDHKWHDLEVTTLSVLLEDEAWKNSGDFYYLNVFIHLELKISLIRLEKSIKITNIVKF